MSRWRNKLQGVAGLAMLLSGSVQAHLLAPALLQLQETTPGEFSVLWRASAVAVQGRELQPVLPPSCEMLAPAKTAIEPGAAFVARWTIRCDASGPGGLSGQTISASGLAASGINVIVRVVFQSGVEAKALLDAAHPVWRVSAEGTSTATVFSSYLQLGIDHLWSGLDHLLFLLGLLLLVRDLRQLIFTVTAFTLGHSLTLSLASLELIQVRQVFAELMIALTIVLLAVELARPQVAAQTSLLRRKPWLMAFAFGLVHGLGFAGALAEIGLPPNEIPLALLSFNIGIEAGQLMLVVAVLAAVRLWHRDGKRLTDTRTGGRLAHMLPTYVIGSFGAYWCIERVVLMSA